MAKLSKRHHYLPQFYLRGFTADDGLLTLFDRETKEFRRQQPVNTALQKDFYTVTDKAGVKTDEVERIISHLESNAKDVIYRLERRVTGWKVGEERANFALFLALFRTRTPVFDQEQLAFTEQFYRSVTRANHPSPEVTAQGFQQFAEATGEDVSDIDPQAVYRMIQDDAYDVEVPRAYIIRLMMDSALHLAEVLMTLNWTFVRAARDIEFITSDAPFVTARPWDETDPRTYGVLTPGAATLVPLSPAVCVVIDGEGGNDRYGYMRKDGVRRVNSNVAQNSDRFIIGRNQPYLERLVKRTRVDQYRWTARFEFNEMDLDGETLIHYKQTRPDPPRR